MFAPPLDSGASMMEEELEVEKRRLLLARIDPEKFLFFYDKYYERIRQFIFVRTVDQDLTEDITSETFLLAVDNLWRFRWQGVTFGAWLFRIAANQLRTHFRRTSRFAEVDNRMINEIPTPVLDPLSEVILSEDQKLVYQAVLELDTLSRNIFLLRFWDGAKLREIAAILDIKEGTIKARLNRDLRKLEIDIKYRLIKRTSDQPGRRQREANMQIMSD